MVTLGAVKKKEFTLIDTGEYAFTLNELDEQMGNWGMRLVWKFLVGSVSDPTAYICNANGEERSVWVFTDQDIILGSIQHEFVEHLMGRKFDQDADPPAEEDLLGRRVIGYLTHYVPTKGKSAGQKQEQIVAGSIKPFKGPQPNKIVYGNQPAKAAPTAAETEHAELRDKVDRLIGKAVKLKTRFHADYVALDLDSADDEQLRALSVTINDEVMAALDA